MTREETMRIAAKRYADGCGIEQWTSKAFIAGAEWADANPQNPWIRVKDKKPQWNDEAFIDLRHSEKREKDLCQYVVRLNNSHDVIVAFCSKREGNDKLRWLSKTDIDIFHIVNDDDYYMKLPPIKE